MRVALVLCLLATTASAEPATKDPVVATVLPAAATAIGLTSMYLAFRHEKAVMTPSEAVLCYGGATIVLVGPALGHVYVGEKSKIRSLMFVSRLLGGLFLFTGWLESNSQRSETDPGSDGHAQLALGATLLIGATAFDIFDAHRAADRHNRRFEVKVAPALQPTLTGSFAPGVVAAARF